MPHGQAAAFEFTDAVEGSPFLVYEYEVCATASFV
jgi:hypothetical protein